MSDLMKPQLEVIRERMNRATPGPWGWFGNTSVHHVYLATQRWGRHMVMQFHRWGMQNAQPSFFDRPNPDEVRQSIVADATFRAAADVPIYEVAPTATSKHDKRVYREDIIGLRNADAAFIAHSRADVEYLVGEVDRLQGLLDAGFPSHIEKGQALRLIGWHCEHRWNTPSDGTHMTWDHKRSKLVRQSNVSGAWSTALREDDSHRCPAARPAFVVVEAEEKAA